MLHSAITRLPKPALELLQFWKDARGPHVLPHIRHFNPLNLRPWIGNISKMEVRGDRFFVRLHGSVTSENIGQNFTGRYMDECAPPHALDLAVAPYKMSIEHLAPTFSILVPGLLSGVFSTFERVALPFTNTAEDDVTSPISVDWFLVWVGPTHIDTLYCSTVYGEEAPTAIERRRAEDAMELMVIDVDDPSYDLCVASHAIAPSAAAFAEAKHA